MVSQVKIVTDSTAYLEAETVRQYDIRVIPLKVAFGNEVFSEGVDITNEEFYRRVAQGELFPTTSQPSPGEFIQVYRELAEQGHPVLSIHISRVMSGTANTALTAKKALPQAQIEVIDATTLAMGMMVVPAAQMAQQGYELPQIKSAIEKLNARISSIGLVENLKYAWKGGRIGAARALVGTLLKIKPVLTFEEGEIKILGKPRTMSGVTEHILDFVTNRSGSQAVLHGWLGHTHALEAALLLEKELRGHFNWASLRVFEIGPVYGTHMGPGFIGMGFYNAADWQPDKPIYH